MEGREEEERIYSIVWPTLTSWHIRSSQHYERERITKALFSPLTEHKMIKSQMNSTYLCPPNLLGATMRY